MTIVKFSFILTGGQGGIRTFVGVSQQIYSLPHLTALVPARANEL